MPDQQLLKKQKNEIFDILINEGLEPTKFSWQSQESVSSINTLISVLTYTGTSFFFKFDFLKGKHYCEFSPGTEKTIEQNYPCSWDIEITDVIDWAIHLKKEIEAPDLWEEFKKYKSSFSLAPSEELLNENIPFNEVEKISEALHSLESKINEHFVLNGHQKESLHSKLDFLIEQAKHQKRREWVYICIGVIVKIAWDLALEPEKRQVLESLFETILKPIIPLIAPTQ